MLADPAKLIVDLIEQTNLEDPQSVARFAKEFQKLQLFGPQYIGPYLRQKKNLPPEKEVVIAGDDILPFLTGNLVGYIAEHYPQNKTELADKVLKLCEKIDERYAPPQGEYTDEENEHRGEWCNNAIQLYSAFSYLKNNQFGIPADDKDMQAVHDHYQTQRQKAKEFEVQALERTITDYSNEIMGCVAIGNAEKFRLSTKKAQQKEDRRTSLTQEFQLSQHDSFTDFTIKMTALSDNVKQLKTQKPNKSDYQDKPEQYQQALGAYADKLKDALETISKQSLEHADALQNHALVRRLHIKEPTNISNKLSNACASMFKKLHKTFPSVFTQETPEFLKTKTQKQVGLIKRNLQQ
ncbi:MAG: hypothetical protein JSR17_03675 [Proteobacteria bacterium]|nr:hypothetical protein [Pseudomonadota bacterium]